MEKMLYSINFFRFIKSTQSGINFVIVLMIALLLSSSAQVNYAQSFRVVKSGPSFANPGDTIEYTIAVKNYSKISAGVEIIDFLPSSSVSTYVSSIPEGKYNASLNTIEWNSKNNPEMVNFAGKEIYFTVYVIAGVAAPGGKYVVPESLTVLSTYSAVRGDEPGKEEKSNIVITKVPLEGNAVLPLE